MPKTSSPAASVRLKTIAVPPEHGAWGFLLEPIVLGLGVAPSAAGLCLAIGVVGAFLARHPLKIVLVDRQRGKRYARTVLAERVALVYSGTAAAGLILALILAGPVILLPLVVGAPLVGIMFAGYARNRGRDLLPELAGACALAGTAAAIVLADGNSVGAALALWALLIARDVPSILYVRARLRLERGAAYASGAVWIAQIVAMVGVLAMVAAALLPMLALVAVIVLALRAVYGLSPYRARVRTQLVGFQEIGFGLLTVVLVIVGHAFGW